MFNLSNWLMRRRIGAQVRSPGSPVEHRRVSNPYHAVSIEPGPRSCAEARARESRRYLSAAAPVLPLKGCTNATCQCRYRHHEDRRAQRVVLTEDGSAAVDQVVRNRCAAVQRAVSHWDPADRTALAGLLKQLMSPLG